MDRYITLASGREELVPPYADFAYLDVKWPIPRPLVHLVDWFTGDEAFDRAEARYEESLSEGSFAGLVSLPC